MSANLEACAPVASAEGAHAAADHQPNDGRQDAYQYATATIE